MRAAPPKPTTPKIRRHDEFSEWFCFGLIGLATAFVTLLRQVADLRAKLQRAMAAERVEELEQDVLRLDDAVQRQRRQLDALADDD